MISCYLQKLVGQIKTKPNEEWFRLKDVIEFGGDAALEAWLQEVASLASDLEINFEAASRGQKPKLLPQKFRPLRIATEGKSRLIRGRLTGVLFTTINFQGFTARICPC